jgi:hypothetical protein
MIKSPKTLSHCRNIKLKLFNLNSTIPIAIVYTFLANAKEKDSQINTPPLLKSLLLFEKARRISSA